MGALNGNQIRSFVKEGHLVIQPFDDDLVQPASYDLRLGEKILASPLGPDELGRAIQLNEQMPRYAIQTGQLVAVMSKEKMVLPLDICSNSFGIRSEFVRKGLHCLGGPHLDPGWRGYLIVSLQNVGPEPIFIELNQPLFTVTFERLEEPVEPGQGYAGNHQDQEDFPEDQRAYILSAKTTSSAEIPTLRQQVARLNVLIEELEERLPDLDEGLELRPEVKEALLESLEKPKDTLLSPEEAWQQFNI